MLERQRLDQERSLLLAWGEVIRRYRRWKQLSRRELAQRAGMSPVFLGEIERGEKDPSSHSLCLIADALEVPLSELVLRVAARLDFDEQPSTAGQTALPRVVREDGPDSLDGVSASRDETAFDVYRLVRRMRGDQQVSLLVLVQSLVQDRSP